MASVGRARGHQRTRGRACWASSGFDALRCRVTELVDELGTDGACVLLCDPVASFTVAFWQSTPAVDVIVIPGRDGSDDSTCNRGGRDHALQWFARTMAPLACDAPWLVLSAAMMHTDLRAARAALVGFLGLSDPADPGDPVARPTARPSADVGVDSRPLVRAIEDRTLDTIDRASARAELATTRDEPKRLGNQRFVRAALWLIRHARRVRRAARRIRQGRHVGRARVAVVGPTGSTAAADGTSDLRPTALVVLHDGSGGAPRRRSSSPRGSRTFGARW